MKAGFVTTGGPFTEVLWAWRSHIFHREEWYALAQRGEKWGPVQQKSIKILEALLGKRVMMYYPMRPALGPEVYQDASFDILMKLSDECFTTFFDRLIGIGHDYAKGLGKDALQAWDGATNQINRLLADRRFAKIDLRSSAKKI